MGASPAAGSKTCRFWCLPDAEEKQKVPRGGRSLPPPGDHQGREGRQQDMTLPWEESTDEWRRRERQGPGGRWGGHPSLEHRRSARSPAGLCQREYYLPRVPRIEPPVVTLCPQASWRAVAWWRQVYGLQGLVLGSRRQVPGSAPFYSGAGCIPVSCGKAVH